MELFLTEWSRSYIVLALAVVQKMSTFFVKFKKVQEQEQQEEQQQQQISQF